MSKKIEHSKEKNKFLPQWKLLQIGAFISVAISILSFSYSIFFIINSEPTTATITQIIEKTDKDGDTFNYPVYEYRDTDGNQFKSKANVGKKKVFIIGDEIRIRFLINEPNKSRIDNFSENWFISLFLGILSIILLVVGFISKLRASRQLNNAL